MDPKTALWLTNTRISELHAEAAASRLASEARKSNKAQERTSVAGSGAPAISRVRSLLGQDAPSARPIAHKY